jgi:Holliday junction resolvase
MLESKIQKKIIDKLIQEGYFVVNLIKTNCSGIPDLLAIKDGKAMFVEVKQPKGKLSPIQEFRIKQIKEKGCEVHVWIDYLQNF